MSIDWSSFTPIASLGGGVMIGAAAAALYLWQGRIAGISGILAQVVSLTREGMSWRLAFLVGLLSGPWLVSGVVAVDSLPLEGSHLALLFTAGLLTGYGTRNARGCTSGHGVCGLSRLSLRSLVAVLCFMGTGMLTVTLARLVANT